MLFCHPEQNRAYTQKLSGTWSFVGWEVGRRACGGYPQSVWLVLPRGEFRRQSIAICCANRAVCLCCFCCCGFGAATEQRDTKSLNGRDSDYPISDTTANGTATWVDGACSTGSEENLARTYGLQKSDSKHTVCRWLFWLNKQKTVGKPKSCWDFITKTFRCRSRQNPSKDFFKLILFCQ